MANHTGANVGCLVVGEYVDEAEPPANLAFHRGEVVRSQVVANYLDLWGRDEGIMEFTVLLKDGRVVAVRGHCLKHWPPTLAGESGSYGIVLRIADEEVVVALFKMLEVIGIFHGEMRSDRKTA
jgi:hypothetical protein